MVRAIVTKTGNSYALRVPKCYIEDNHLKLGDTVNIEDPLELQRKALDDLIEQGKKYGPIKAIADPVAWQRKQRESSDPWEEVLRDSAR
jgi:antitoxin component of MazEF toxin-antitoxin module